MALKNYVEQTSIIEIPGNEPLVVRGFSLPDVISTINSQRHLAEGLFEKVVSGELDGQNAEEILVFLFDEFSPILGQIIATAAGEPEEWQVAARLPISVQADALEKILALTFESAGGPGKFVEALQKLLSGTVLPKTD